LPKKKPSILGIPHDYGKPHTVVSYCGWLRNPAPVGGVSHYDPIIYTVLWLPIVANWCRISSVHSIGIILKRCGD